MRIPIKIDSAVLPTWLRSIVPSKLSPAGLLEPGRSHSDIEELRATHSRRVSAFVSEGTWKSTRPGRHKLSQAVIGSLLTGQDAVIVDIGVSDGVTALELVEALGPGFSRYHVTDRRLWLRYERSGNSVRFCEAEGSCVCATGRWFISYPVSVPTNVFEHLGNWLAAQKARGGAVEVGELCLLQPELVQMAKHDPRVLIAEHDVFDSWPDTNIDLVKVGNVLNRIYFSDDRIAMALMRMFALLKIGGFLVICENREKDAEQGSVFEKVEEGFRLVTDIGRGTDIRDLVLGFRGRQVTRPDSAYQSVGR